MTKPNRSTDELGRAIYDEFDDLYGDEVSVRQSDHDGKPCVVIFSERLSHLGVEHAIRLRDALDAFIAENSEAQA